MTRVRILHLVLLFTLAAVALLGGLAHLMVRQHEDWLELSYRNRWVFRDVPTRRGSILDRNGALISEDRPAQDLELNYRVFRRSHVVGLAVHGGNVLCRLSGRSPQFRMDRPSEFRIACDALLDVPVSVAGGTYGSLDRDLVRDLRFYVSALGFELTGLSAGRLQRAILDAAEAERPVRVRQVVLEVCAAISARWQGARRDAPEPPRLRSEIFDARVEELRALARRLAGLDARFDLWAFLEQRRGAAERWRLFCSELDEDEQRAMQDPGFWEWIRRRGAPAGTWLEFAGLPDGRREALLSEYDALPGAQRRALARVPFEVRPWDGDNPELLDLDPAELAALRDGAFWGYLAGEGLAIESWSAFAALDRSRRADLCQGWAALGSEARAAAALHAPDVPWIDGDPRALLLGAEDRTVLADPGFWEWLRRCGVGCVSQAGFAELPDAVRAELRDGYEAVGEAARVALREIPQERLPWNEAVPRSVQRRIGYDDAVWLTLLGERHPGFETRPSVVRVLGRLPDRDDLGTLSLLLGSVTPLWRDDVDEQEDEEAWRALAARISGDSMDGYLQERPDDVPETLDETLRRSAQNTVYRHYLSQGRLGRGGVESAIDAELSGAPGLRLVERDRRREQRLLDSLDVRPGRDVRLTIDLRLQALLEQSLDGAAVGSERAVTVIDAGTGDVLALTGWPVEDAQGRPRILSSALFPRTSPFIGSVAKPFVALEQLDAERNGRDHATAFAPCAGRFTKSLRCGHTHGVQALDPVLAIGRSCNVYFFIAARGLGTDGVRHAFARVGWVPGHSAAVAGRYTDQIDGLPSSWVAAPRMTAYRFEMQAIGYGVQVNTAFVARAYAALATGWLPTLGLVCREEMRPRVPLGVDLRDLETVRAGMQDCVEAGTGRRVALGELGVRAKTGTAEINAARSNNAWFAGYGPPGRSGQLAFAAVLYNVPDGSGGGGVAAPVIADFLRRVAADPELAAAYLGR